jgi:hypothetical protein
LCTAIGHLSPRPASGYGRIGRVSTSLSLLSVDARVFGSDRAALAQAIAAADVDAACVHDSPHLLRWRSISAAIGRRAGLVVVTGGRPAGANLLLSTLAVEVGAVRDVRFDGGTRFARPGAALAALRLRGTDFVLGSATFAGNDMQRLAQARALEAEISTLVPGGAPAIIAARGAERSGTAVWQSLVENRVGVAGRLFVDGRVTIAEALEPPGNPGAVAVRLEI